jgi:hypothetical protein
VLASSACLHLLMRHWTPDDTVVYTLPLVPQVACDIGMALGWLLALVATFNIDHCALFGLEQAVGVSLRVKGTDDG